MITCVINREFSQI